MTTPLWVFGYGSLMWNPGFPVVETRRAHLRGLHRALCIYSVVHRGTPAVPGLVFGLDHGGICEGLAFRVDPAHATQVLDYLGAREQVTGVYRKTRVTLALAPSGQDGRGSGAQETPPGASTASGERGADTSGWSEHVRAVCYRADRTHPQYTGPLSLEQKARIVMLANGGAGRNLEYVFSTARQLRALGIADRQLFRLEGLLRRAPGAIGSQFTVAGSAMSGPAGWRDASGTRAQAPWAHRKRAAEHGRTAPPLPSDPISRGAYRRRLGL